ncbi:MAG: hypothetical protein QOD66_2287 [Solirubrobacteraceae bacterium]|nr:hypothetical protein [Solirubrobacteraceae bacterium]
MARAIDRRHDRRLRSPPHHRRVPYRGSTALQGGRALMRVLLSLIAMEAIYKLFLRGHLRSAIGLNLESGAIPAS